MVRSLQTILERLLAAALLTLTAPLWIAVAIGVWVTSGRPVLFTQVRVGRDGWRFTLFKFRSMRITCDGTAVTGGGDGRVTAIGRVLRKYKLDELPQLYNILRGDMALVGPRPEVPQFVDMSDPRWRQLLSGRPGVTDFATLVFRHEEDQLAGIVDLEDYYRRIILPEKLALSLEYQRARTIVSDTKLILLTAWYSVSGARRDSAGLRKLLLGQ